MPRKALSLMLSDPLSVEVEKQHAYPTFTQAVEFLQENSRVEEHLVAQTDKNT